MFQARLTRPSNTGFRVGTGADFMGKCRERSSAASWVRDEWRSSSDFSEGVAGLPSPPPVTQTSNETNPRDLTYTRYGHCYCY